MLSNKPHHPLFVPALIREGHLDEIISISYSKGYALVASKDKSISLWDLSRRISLFTAQFTIPIRKACLMNGRYVIIGLETGEVQKWDSVKGKFVHKYSYPGSMYFTDISASDNYVGIIVGDKAYIYRDNEFYMQSDGAGIEYTTIFMFGNYAALGRKDGIVEVWDLVDKHRNGFLLAHEGEILHAILTPYHLITVGKDELVIVWDLISFGEIHRFTGLGPITTISATEKDLLIGSTHGVVKVWGLRNFDLRGTLLGHVESIAAGIISEQGVLTADIKGELRFWEPVMLREEKVIPVNRPPIHIVANREVLVVYDGVLINVYEFPSKQPTHSFSPPTAEIKQISIMEDVLVIVGKKLVYTYDLKEFNPVKLVKKIKPKDVIPVRYPTPLIVGSNIILVFSYEKEKEVLDELYVSFESPEKAKKIAERIELFINIVESGYPIVKYTDEATWLLAIEWIAKA